jgi:hypothetical protein
MVNSLSGVDFDNCSFDPSSFCQLEQEFFALFYVSWTASLGSWSVRFGSCVFTAPSIFWCVSCNGVSREHSSKWSGLTVFAVPFT